MTDRRSVDLNTLIIIFIYQPHVYLVVISVLLGYVPLWAWIGSYAAIVASPLFYALGQRHVSCCWSEPLPLRQWAPSTARRWCWCWCRAPQHHRTLAVVTIHPKFLPSTVDTIALPESMASQLSFRLERHTRQSSSTLQGRILGHRSTSTDTSSAPSSEHLLYSLSFVAITHLGSPMAQSSYTMGGTTLQLSQ